MRGSIAAVLALLSLSLPASSTPANSAGAAIGCFPPEPPFVPQSDDDFRDYADLVAADFERYFSSLTDYFHCVDSERQAVFEQAKGISSLHQQFYDRADRLGVRYKTAVPYNNE